MSYRTYVNGKQLFGNNDCFPEWIDFVKRSGIRVDSDYRYRGYISDIDGALDTLELILRNMESFYQKRKETLLDFSEIKACLSQSDTSHYLTDELMDSVERTYLYLPVQFIQNCGGLIERRFNPDGRLYSYVLKSSRRIKVFAS